MRIQLEVIQRCTSTQWTQGNLRPGDVVWVDENAARHLLENGICRYVGGEEKPVAGPIETPEAGPSEIKEATVPKFVGDRTDGPTTVSQSSNAPGPGILSSASAAALVLPKRL